MNLLLLLILSSLSCLISLSNTSSTPPPDVKIGSIFSLGTINGRVAKIAMNAAIDDVNSDPTILAPIKLTLSTYDSNYSGFRAIIGGLQYMETNTVAIIGPQVSGMAHVLSHFANHLHVPMLSFTALDPTLASLQYPFFIQTAPNDLYQMTAIADFIAYFGYRQLAVVYPDDDQSRGTIMALAEKLAARRCAISYKALLSPEGLATSDEIINQLVQVSLMESRVVVVHAFAAVGLKVFQVARRLGMMDRGYVWIATTWLSTVLESTPVSSARSIQGVITFRPHTPDSARKRAFLSRWDELSNGTIGLNANGLYAYDTVWMIANAIKAFRDDGGVISFSNDSSLSGLAGAPSLRSLSRFDGGKQLLSRILETNTTGLTGRIAFDAAKSVIRPSFDIINVIGSGYKQIGYWSNYSGLSVLPPEILAPNLSSSDQKLRSVVWPGGTTAKPRGWDFPRNGRPLRIGIPDRVSYKAFVSKDENTNKIHGYCIDVFLAAKNLLPYAVSHEFVLFGDKRKNPSYAELISMITSNVFDGVVGDIAIVTNRTKIVDFTQPYAESGLVVVAPVRKLSSSPWAFMRPFTLPMWAITGAFFLIVGFVVWILEHKMNDDFRGPPMKQLITILLFGFSTMFFAHRENTVSPLGRMVLIIWLFVVLIITSSYTASLTSMLTVQQLAPSIRGIDSLITSNDRIGFQVGSFAESYLTEELSIAKSRLIALGSPEEYAVALKDGRVAAIVDERPYVDLFLSKYCAYQVVGREFTKGGWGFAFPRDSPLAMDMSTAILTLSENGDLQKIHDKWLNTRACGSPTSLDTEQLKLTSFWGLFLICGIACFLSLLIFCCSIVRKFKRHSPSRRNSLSIRFQKFLSFADRKEEEEEEGGEAGTTKTKWKRDHLEMMSGSRQELASSSLASMGTT